MPINISKNLRAKLPVRERGDIDQLLIDKAGDVCHLCDGPINQASDRLVADHHIPESAGGATELANLNLVHTECNSFKRDHPTVSVRPFLRLARFLRESNGPANYADCIELLSIDPMASHIKEVIGGMEFQFPDGSVCVTPVHTVTTREGDFAYSFVDVPRTAIFNDDSCQPRSINQRHLWAIYSDLAWNPLHEPPGLRVQPDPDDSKMTRLLMFDGQHKTLASWLLDYDTVSCKVYLNITEKQTVRLVNSVQAKIKKLPLSPFELSAKMAVEWRDRIERYESQVGTDAASEAGFLSWVGKDERARARSAFKDALFQNIIDRDDLTYLRHVARPGARKGALQVTEAAFRNKVLTGLLHVRALDESFEQGQRLRDREAETITRVLNSLADLVYDPDQNDGKLSERQKTRAKRLTYQSALQYVASLIKAAVRHILFAEEDREFLDKSPNKNQWKQIEEALQRIVDHPVWTKDFGDSKKMEAVELALTKNQNATKAFKDVELRHGYVMGAEKLDRNSLN